jgi:hypothetical protein
MCLRFGRVRQEGLLFLKKEATPFAASDDACYFNIEPQMPSRKSFPVLFFKKEHTFFGATANKDWMQLPHV